MNRHRYAIFALAGVVGVGLISASLRAVENVGGGAKTSGKGEVHFNRDIRPILSENCFACHGPDPASRKEGLRLDREDGLFGERKGGKAVMKGDPGHSLLYQRVNSDDEDEVMPPP